MVISEHFGDPEREYKAAVQQAALFNFPERGKVVLTGSEAIPFLQNLCTNDIKKLQPGTGCEAFLTTAKARIIAPITVSRLQANEGKTLLLDTPTGLNEKVVQHLSRYRISEDVEIKDRTTELAQLYLCGPASESFLEKLSGTALPDLTSLHHLEQPGNLWNWSVIRRNDFLQLPGYELFFPTKETDSIWTSLVEAGAIPADLQVFEILRVEAGLPLFGKEMDEERLAMEVGRTAQAISFNKGCYLGQETIVMARDRGHVNRSLMGLRIPGKNPVSAGSKVFHDGEELGQVTSSVFSPRLGMAIALAFLKRGWQTPGTKVEVESGSDKIQAEVSSLPFLGS